MGSSIFNSLNIGYSGLTTSQSGINTTSHNISNANTPGYSKQRVNQVAQVPMHDIPGDVGNGVLVDTITRAHDSYIFGRYTSSQSNLEFTSYKQKTLEEISDYFPDMQNLGIGKDMQDFFNSWSDLSKDPNSDAQKMVLINNTAKLTRNINDTQEKLESVQTRLNDEFAEAIGEVNKLAKQIVTVNKNINKVESVRQGNANDLRDQRDQLELQLNKYMNISVFKGKLGENTKQRTDMGTSYNININGHNLVDGTTYHPITIETTNRFNIAKITTHDGTSTDITSNIRGGKIGAIVELRGSGIDGQSKPVNSKIQDYIDNLNSFAKGMIQKVNSIYAQSAKESMHSNELEINNDTLLLDTKELSKGSFNVLVYNNQGDVVAKRAIDIDENTSLDSIVTSINAQKDDNNDNDGTNDIDDIFEAKLVNNRFVLEQKDGVSGYHIAIEDNNTNFAGYTGVNSFFKGNDAKDIAIADDLIENPTSLQAFKSPVDGNNELANEMVTLQYEAITFNRNKDNTSEQTLESFYRFSTAEIATDAANASISHDAAESLDRNINERLKAVSDVSMDEELMNLMKYQAAYQASAKVISTIDQMINSLLGIKQ